MKRLAQSPRVAAFTLVEIMIVVLVVGILSTLALAAISRIKARAVESMIRNNLRQLYQAQEFFFATEGEAGRFTSYTTLGSRGYISQGVLKHLQGPHTMEANAGWHYILILRPGQPVAAYKGAPVFGSAAPTGDAIFYPAPPTGSDYWTPQVRPR